MLGIFALSATGGVAQTIRLANGVLVKADTAEGTPQGLLVKTSKGDKTYEWSTLSPATRFYYEPVYRANYDVVLRGLPASRRVKTPLPDVVEAAPSGRDAAPATRVNDAATKSTGQAKSLRITDHIQYENIEPLRAGAVPNLDLRSAASAAYWGLQYGPARSQIAYFVFDARDINELRDVLFVYGLEGEHKSTTRIKAMKKRAGDSYVAKFRGVELSGKFGAIDATFDIGFTYAIGTPRDLEVVIDVTLAADGESCSFKLFGQPTDLIYSEGTINVRGVLDIPVLWLSLDPASASPRLVGDLRMSRMKLCPMKGMEKSVVIEVRDKQGGDIIQRHVADLNEDMFTREYAIVADMKRMSPGKSYFVRASIGLGPFLGEVLCEETVHVPKAP